MASIPGLLKRLQIQAQHFFCLSASSPTLALFVVRMRAGNFSKGTELVLLLLSVPFNTPSLVVRMRAGNFSKGITELFLLFLSVPYHLL